jgi:uncharacterized membrane protein YjjB (DUF3815 family)
MNLTLLLLRDMALAFPVAVGFAILFNTPRNVLAVAGLLGGCGHLIRFLLLHYQFGMVPSTLAATLFIGLIGIPVAHRVHTPPVVFTMPACITMIPGLPAYRTMLGLLRLTDPEQVRQDPALLQLAAHHFVLTASLLFTLAIGICIGPLLFRTRSVKSLFRQFF